MSRSTDRNTPAGIPEDVERNQPNEALSSEDNVGFGTEDESTNDPSTGGGKWHGTIISPDPRPIRREEVHLLCQVLPNCIMSMLYQCGTES
jgi:hypothetical protein